jgi:hypothetical protein
MISQEKILPLPEDSFREPSILMTQKAPCSEYSLYSQTICPQKSKLAKAFLFHRFIKTININ